VVKQLTCYFKYCEFEYKEVTNLKKKVNNACNIVIEAYKNKQNDSNNKNTFIFRSFY